MKLAFVFAVSVPLKYHSVFSETPPVSTNCMEIFNCFLCGLSVLKTSERWNGVKSTTYNQADTIEGVQHRQGYIIIQRFSNIETMPKNCCTLK